MKKTFLPDFVQKILLVVLFIVLGAVFLNADQLGFGLSATFYLPLMISVLAILLLTLVGIIFSLFKQRILLAKTPLLKPLILFFLTVLMSIFFNYSLENHLPWFSIGGFCLCLVIFFLVVSSLFSARQTKFALSLSNLLTIFLSSMIFLQGCELLFNFNFLPARVQLLPTSWLAILIAFLSGIIAVFVRKGKNSYLQKALLSFLIFGFIGLGILLYKQSSLSLETASLKISWQTLEASLTNSPLQEKSTFLTKIFQSILGYGSENYSNFYQLFKPSWVNQSVWHQSNFTQSSLGFFTVGSTLGLLGGATFIWLIFILWKNLPLQLNQGNYFFLLATVLWSFQLFIPLEVPLLVLATFLLAGSCWTGPTFDYKRSLQTPISLIVLGNFSGIILMLIILWASWRTAVNFQTRSYYQFTQTEFADFQSSTKTNSQIEKINQTYQKTLQLQSNFDFIYRAGSLYNLETTLTYFFQTSTVSDIDLIQQNKNLNNSVYLAKQATIINPYQAQNWFNLGDIYRDVAQVTTQVQVFQELAQNAYLKAQQLEPQDCQALFKMGQLALDQKDFTTAENYFLEATTVQPKSIEAHFYLAYTYQLQEKKALAKASYQTAFSLLDRNSTTYNDDYRTLTEKLNQLN